MEHGGERIRTADLCVANALLSQLSYTPKGGILPPFIQKTFDKASKLFRMPLIPLARHSPMRCKGLTPCCPRQVFLTSFGYAPSGRA